MYTETDVIDYVTNQLKIKKTRERVYIDPRNYLLALLAYKFNYTEASIAALFNVARSSINHAKRHPYSMLEIKDVDFMKNAEEVIRLFPYNFPVPSIRELKKTDSKMDRINVYLTEEMHDQIKELAQNCNIRVPTLIRKLIITSFKVMNKMSDEYKLNPNYQNGYFWGTRTADLIETSNYKTLENALLVKKELLQDFEEHFKWDMSHKDYAETRGAIDAFQDALSNKSKTDEQGSDSEGST
jgi:hypothetical protein